MFARTAPACGTSLRRSQPAARQAETALVADARSTSPPRKSLFQDIFHKLANLRLLARPRAGQIECGDLVIGDKIPKRLSPALLSGMNAQARLVVFHGELAAFL
jgi:hypothetical protein